MWGICPSSGPYVWGIWTAFWNWRTGIWPPKIEKFKSPGGGDVKRLQIDRCIQVWPLKWKLSMSTLWWWCSRCCWTKFMFLQILYLIWTEKHGRERVKGMPAASEAVINPHAKHPWWGKIYFAVCWWSFLNPWGKWDGLWLHQNLEPQFSVHWRVRLKNLFSDSLSELVLFRSSLMRVDDDSAR